MRGTHLKKPIARILVDAGLKWRSSNQDLHWQVKDLGIDIWPTRLKTMRKGKVKVWYSLEDFGDWIKSLSSEVEDRSRTKPKHDLPLYAGDVPPWEDACFDWTH